MKVQFIRTEGGAELVLPRQQFEALVRRARLAPADGDREAADALIGALADIEADRDTQIPESIWRELQTGGSRLRILRSWRGMTQQGLALRLASRRRQSRTPNAMGC